MNKTLVDRALKKAEEAEKQGDKKKADYFYNLAEKAEELYNRMEK